MEAGKRYIRDIFSGSMRLEIPFFQRSYVWGEPQWERFLDDAETVCASDESYFMGSLILKQKPTNSASSVGNVRTVVDGQQRLTTLSVLMKVLSLKTGSTRSFDRQFILIDDTPALLHNRNDEAAYNRIMKLESLDDLEGADGITRLYRYFKDKVDPEKLNFDKICNLIYFVGIDLSFDEDEQQIFDTINSLGVRLTTAELLKNYFFGRNDIASYEENWVEIFEKDEETRAYWDQVVTSGSTKRTFLDLLFYSFLLVKVQENSYGVTAEDKTRYSRVEQLFGSYKSFIEKYAGGDRSAILRDIREYAVVFRKAISFDVLTEELASQAGIDRINVIMFALDTSTLLPYVLFIEKNVEDEKTRNEIYDYLEAYVMRRLVTRQNTKNYYHLFSDKLILNRVLTREDLVRALADGDDTNSRMPANEEVVQAFHESRLTNKYAKGALYLIESRIRDRNMHSTSLLGIDKYSLEHLMPKKWRNNWTFAGTTAEEEKRDQILLTLGNLTIITQALNASIRDADWATKRFGKGEKGGLLKYAEGIETIYEYLNGDVWDEKSIYKRAEDLAAKALEVWKV